MIPPLSCWPTGALWCGGSSTTSKDSVEVPDSSRRWDSRDRSANGDDGSSREWWDCVGEDCKVGLGGWRGGYS